jgi:UDP-4-amino-4-deoxy-L-arabinose formyltransferase/UDP-glucuronic acid dehydrogenase (UDP-4-keto-hexauronic acid decarboxylating)
LDVEFFEKHDYSVGLCIGWQRLLPDYVLDRFSVGVFGMHGSTRNLPFGKGRSPMNWSIIENRRWFTTNLFKYESGIDNGPVVGSLTFSINKSDTAETLHYKNTLSMCTIVQSNLQNLVGGNITVSEQDISEGETFYPKRSPLDGVIDWRDDIFSIERLVRAVSPPFYGAVVYIGDEEFRIFRASVFYTDLEHHPFLSANFGEVLEMFPSNKFLVRCSGGVLIVHEHDRVSLAKGVILSIKESPFIKFNRNIYGFFDM